MRKLAYGAKDTGYFAGLNPDPRRRAQYAPAMSARRLNINKGAFPILVYGVCPERNASEPFKIAGSNAGMVSMTCPLSSMIAVIPALVARACQRRLSDDRVRAICKC